MGRRVQGSVVRKSEQKWITVGKKLGHAMEMSGADKFQEESETSPITSCMKAPVHFKKRGDQKIS